MAKTKTEKETPKVVETSVGMSELAQALVQAIETTKPPQKKTAITRKPNTPWTPKDGSPKLKLKRKMYQHGILIDEDLVSNEEVELLNKLKPGLFLNGHVKVYRRRDRGIDIDYPIKTAAQRLKLVNQFGIRNLAELLQRCISEAENPAQYKHDDE
jgi:hypothetical protein